MIGLVFPRISPVAQTQSVQLGNSTENLSNPLKSPNLENINKSLSEINQLEIVNDITRPLNDVIRSFLNSGQGSSIIPRLKASLDGLNSPNTSNTMSIGEIISKSKEAFILIAQILVAVLETALWVLKGVLGWIT